MSPYLAGEVRAGDRFELRGPIGGYFVWTRGARRPAVPGRRRLRRGAADGHAAPSRGGQEHGAGDAALFLAHASTTSSTAPNSISWPGRATGLRVVHTLTREQPGRLERLHAPHRPRHAARRRFCAAMRGRAFSSAGRRRWSKPRRSVCAISATSRDSIKTERFGPTGSEQGGDCEHGPARRRPARRQCGRRAACANCSRST